MINMIIPIHIEDKNVIFEEDLIAKITLIGNNIEQVLEKDLRGLKVICSNKTSSTQRVTHKRKKKIKHADF